MEEGDHVQEGQFLLQIDPIPYQANLANAKAALNGARSELDSARASLKQLEQTYLRKEKMVKDGEGLISQDEYDRARSDYEVQKARVQSAQHAVEQSLANVQRSQDDLDKTRVVSPMTGIVVRKAVEEGEVAVIGTMNNPGTVLLTVADLSIIQAELEVDEVDIGGVKIGQPASVTVDAFPGKKFPGVVSEIGNSPLVKNTTATAEESTDFKVTITLNSPDAGLRPGLTADGEITTGVRDSCLTVPIQALVVRDISKEGSKKNLPKEQREKEGVFLMQNGKAVFRPVKTGIMGEMDIEVEQGVKEGDQLVTGTYQTLRELKDSDPVKIQKEPKEEEKKKT